jgi:hypothetical protein
MFNFLKTAFSKATPVEDENFGVDFIDEDELSYQDLLDKNDELWGQNVAYQIRASIAATVIDMVSDQIERAVIEVQKLEGQLEAWRFLAYVSFTANVGFFLGLIFANLH